MLSFFHLKSNKSSFLYYQKSNKITIEVTILSSKVFRKRQPLTSHFHKRKRLCVHHCPNSFSKIAPASSLHLLKSLSTNLTTRFSSSQPSVKRRSGRLVDVIKHLSLKIFCVMTPSLKGWPDKTKKVFSPHKVRLTLMNTNPVFFSFSKFLLYVLQTIIY